MAEIFLKINTDTQQSVQSISSLEEELNNLKNKIKDVAIGSAEFKKLQSEIVAADTALKNVNKSIEGVDTEKLVGEIGKFAGGVTQAFAGLTLILGEGNKSVEELQKSLNKAIGIVMAVKGAMDAFTASVNLAKAAQTALNTVMKSNPWGLAIAAIATIVVSITALITKEKELTQAEKESIAAMEERQATMKQNYTIYQENIKAVEDFIATLENQSKTQLQVALDQLNAARTAEMAVGSQAAAIKALNQEIANLIAMQIALGSEPKMSQFMKNGVYDANAHQIAIENYKKSLSDLPYQLEQANAKLIVLEKAEEKHTTIINEKYDALEAELRQTIAKNAALEKQKKLLEARNRFEMDYLDRIKQLQINAIDDERRREEEQAKFDYELSVKKITNEIKLLEYGKEKKQEIISTFTFWYKENYDDKLREIDKKYSQDKAKDTKKTYTDIENIQIEYVDKSIELLKKFEEEEEKARQKRAEFFENLKELFSADSLNFINDNITNVFIATFDSLNIIFDTFYDKTATKMDKVKSVIVGVGETINKIFSVIADELNSAEQEQLEALVRRYDISSARYQKMLDEQRISQEEYNNAMSDLEKEKAASEKKIKHDAFEKERQAAIIQATIAGIVGAVAQFEAGPVGIVLSALVGALAVVQIALIASQKNPYATGGLVGQREGLIKGPGTGTSDSIKADVSAGEYIVNAKATSSFLPLLETINAFGKNNMTPGVVQQPSLSSVMAKTIYLTSQNDRLIRAYVVASDINNANSKIDRSIRRASLG